MAATHRDLVATGGTTSGQVNTNGFPPYRFLAAVAVRHISGLSDALVGQRRWDDPQEIVERNWLLGPNDEAAWKFVKGCRRRMKKTFRANMGLVRELEKEYYGENSFYYLHETGQYKAPTHEEAEEEHSEGFKEMEIDG